MERLYGRYRGLTPTDESAVGMGEIRVVIDAKWLVMTVATGHGVHEESHDSSYFREMTVEEIAVDFIDDADLEGIRGIISVDATPATVEDFTRLLFTPASEGGEECVILRGLFGEEAFGPTILLTPAQQQAGKFEELIGRLEELQGESGIVPLIKNEGRASRDVETGR